MKHRPALYALIRLHAELQGRVKQNREETQRLRSDMRHVEHVLKLLEPGFNIAGIASRRKYKVNPVFRRRKLIVVIAPVLREAGRPQTAQEIAAILIERYYTTELTRKQRHDMGGHVIKVMRRYPTTFQSDGGRPQRWSIVGVAERQSR